jgi:small-conductance mechanosensitive channel
VLIEYRAFLDAQVFWTADMRPVRRESVDDFRAFVRAAADPARLRSVVEDVRASIEGRPVAWLLSAGLVAVLVTGWPGGRSLVERLLPTTASPAGLAATVRAAAIAMTRALPLPLGLHLFGRLLGSTALGDASAALAHASSELAVPAFWLSLVTTSCARNGLATEQLGWTRSVAETLRRAATTASRIVLPFMGVMSFASWGPGLPGAAEVERAACVAALGTLAMVSFRVFGPRNGVFAGIVERHPSGWIATFAPTLRAALTAVPTALAVAALLGYASTAEIVLEDLLRSWMVLFAVGVGASAFERAGQGAFRGRGTEVRPAGPQLRPARRDRHRRCRAGLGVAGAGAGPLEHGIDRTLVGRETGGHGDDARRGRDARHDRGPGGLRGRVRGHGGAGA